MLFYSKGDRYNVLVTLDQIESAVILLSAPAAALDAEYAKRHLWASSISCAMQTGGNIHVIVLADKGDASLDGLRGPITALPQPYCARVTAALAAIAKLFRHESVTDTVDCIGQRALP